LNVALIALPLITLGETLFIDVAHSIWLDMFATTLLIRVVRNIDFWRGNYRDKDMPRYDLSIAIFVTIRYIVPSLEKCTAREKCTSRENPGYAYEKRTPLYVGMGPPEWLIHPCMQYETKTHTKCKQISLKQADNKFVTCSISTGLLLTCYRQETAGKYGI